MAGCTHRAQPNHNCRVFELGKALEHLPIAPWMTANDTVDPVNDVTVYEL
jgi:hypothetical protein